MNLSAFLAGQLPPVGIDDEGPESRDHGAPLSLPA
jgi:hypothetical protein